MSSVKANPKDAVIRKQVQSIQFGFYTDVDVRERSVVEVTSSVAFDPNGNALPGGLYDASMGPYSAGSGGAGGGSSPPLPCSTCACKFGDCPGHAGHVELAVPVHHPLLLDEILTVLRCKCLHCHRFRAAPRPAAVQAAKFQLLRCGRLDELQALDGTLAAAMHGARSGDGGGDDDTAATTTSKAASTRAAATAMDSMLQDILKDATTTTTPTPSSSSSNNGHNAVVFLPTSHHRTLYASLVKETVALLKSAVRCAHCGAYSPKLRHDSHNKIFQVQLSGKMRRLNAAERICIAPALQQQQQQDDNNNNADTTTTRDNNNNAADYDSDDTDRDEDDTATGSSTLMEIDEEGVAATAGNSDDDDDDDGGGTKSTAMNTKRDKFMHTAEVQAQFQRLWAAEPFLCASMFGSPSTNKNATTTTDRVTDNNNNSSNNGSNVGCEKYFLQAVPVPPSRFRPPMHLNGMSVEHAQTAALAKILLHNAAVREKFVAASATSSSATTGQQHEADQAAAAAAAGSAYQSWIELQTAVNCYMDSAKDPAASAGQQPVAVGIRQILERKEGLFRKNMMGKRVDHACRSVISPDPYVGTNEIGLPRYFASVLTYPTPVIERNVAEMRALVERGPHQYPGARWVEGIASSSSSSSGNNRQRVDLGKMNAHQRQAVAAQLLQHVRRKGGSGRPVIVGRQLRDGDYVLMNRQPTLHKPGIMAHRVRVLHNPTQKTIRMHYANCNTYNADFDGDEMNCHFPQNDLARAEAQFIAQTDLQYIVPTDGSPLRGLIQDHVVGGVKMTKKDTFFKKWEYQQLLFAALSSLSGLEVIRHCDSIEMVPPAIVKPCELWTGKQVITTILLHLRKGSDRDSAKLSNLPGLSMDRQSKTPDTAFGAAQEEHLVLIRDGELLRGVLDKNAFGATDFSLVHSVYEAYGPEKAGLLLNVLGRLFTAYIQYYSGHSCRMEDLVLTKKADLERRNLVQRAYNIGARAAKAWADSEGGKVAIPPVKDQPGAEEPLKPVEAASAAAKIGLLLSGNEGKENFAALDGFMQSQLNPLASDIVKKSLPSGLAVPFPHNTFGIMTTTGAKGSIVNQSQVTCALGQQALEGRRVPRMSSGRTLPSFAPYDPNPRADGFVMDRFLTGIRPQEYYFHCMAGREGLVDTAVKTSRSGYLQRCLVKHLEELKICYDYTVRNAEGNVIQFLYGEDGLDPTKSSYLDCSARSFEYMARNHDSLKRHNTALPSSTIEIAAEDDARHEELQSGSPRVLLRGDAVMARRLRSGQDWVRGALCLGWSFATITKVHKDGKTVDLNYHADGLEVKRVPIEADLGGAGGKQTMALTSKATIVKACALDPIISSASRGHLFGSSGACVSERVASAASSAMANATKLGKVMADIKLTEKDLSSLIGAKYSSSVCAPGEAVGSIAAQSVGEPSTQMTLNTFHLAGAGANVTLGIPRLREIIMTASRTLKTPTMSVPLLESVTEKQAVRLARGFTKLTLMDLIAGKRGISVTERLEKGDAGGWLRAYYVTIKLHPAERIKEAFGLSLHDIAKVVAKNYVPLLSQIMKKELKRSAVDGDGDVGEVVGGGASDYLDDGNDSNADTQQVTSEADDLNEEDDDDDMDDAPGEEDGVEFGRRKENASYDDGRGAETSDDDDERGAAQSSPSMPEQTDPAEEKLNDRCAPTVLKQSNSIALQALKVEPSVRPLLMVGLVEKAASTILVRSRKNIDEAFLNDEMKRGRCLQTAGINFEEMWKLETVKHNELTSNDIWAVRCSYGVEAARSSIMGQIRSVFGAYGIEVDPRHLSLIADYMTYDGGFKPMSRIGMEDCSSTLLQMSFETTAHFLKKAALTNSMDCMESPSANIVVGRPIRHGTGAFSLLAKT